LVYRKCLFTSLVGKDKNNNFSAGNVSFEVNARTNWHTHPKEQVLLIIDGEGLYQEKGKPAKQIRKGDVINIPENIEHWHGASSTSQMTHIAITNYEGDNQVNWLQPVQQMNTAPQINSYELIGYSCTKV
jgi:quercetin dioxygenase-like cupin family protein